MIHPSRTGSVVMTIVAVAVASVLTGSPVRASAATWGTPVDLSATGQSATLAQIAMSTDGHYRTVAWSRSDGSRTVVQSASSSDFGASWTVPQNVSASGQNAQGQRVAMSADGQYQALTWRRYDGANWIAQMSRSSDHGSTWSTPMNLSPTGQNVNKPELSMSNDGLYLTVTWYRYATDQVTQSTTSSDRGATWSSPTDLSSTVAGETSYNPTVSMSSNGHYQTVTWSLRVGGSSWTVQSRTSADYGVTWASVVDLSAPTTPWTATHVDVAMSSDGHAQTISWSEQVGASSYAIKARSSTTSGATWGAAVTVSSASSDTDYPQVALSSEGLYQTITWYRSDGSNTIVQASSTSNSGAAWGVPVDISAAGGSAWYPQVALSSDGMSQTIAWYRSNGSNDIIQVSSSADRGLTWSAPVNLSAVGGTTRDPVVAMSTDGQYQAVAWNRYNNGSNNVIQTSRFPSPAPVVSSVSPSSGSTVGGTSMSVTGSNFVSGSSVSVGGTSCSSVTFTSSTQLMCTTPAGAAGAADVVVTNPDTQAVTFTGGFTYTSSGGGGGGGEPSPSPTASSTPTPAPTPSALPTPTAPPTPAPTPSTKVPAGISVLRGAASAAAKPVTVPGPASTSAAKAPVVSVPMNAPVAPVVRGLPPKTALQAGMSASPFARMLAQASATFSPLGTTRSNSAGRAKVPAFKASRPGMYTIRLTTPTGRAYFVKVKVTTKKPKPRA